MSVHSIAAEPLSRQEIRSYAFEVRRTFHFENQLYFPIVQFVEMLHTFIPQFVFEVVPESEIGECHGLTFPEQHLMKIREDVYLRAVNGSGRDRATIAHELGHYVFHQPSRVGHARLAPGEKLLPFRDPEWQAKAFAGELLVPAHLANGMKAWDVAKRCGVSLEAAQIQLCKI